MNGVQGLHFFSVCDGHGVNGHHVSNFLREKLPGKVFAKINDIVHFLETLK